MPSAGFCGRRCGLAWESTEQARVRNAHLQEYRRVMAAWDAVNREMTTAQSVAQLLALEMQADILRGKLDRMETDLVVALALIKRRRSGPSGSDNGAGRRAS